jgi:hypothetical protein
MSLEAKAVSARGGFACVFSTSDEYERALISERRAKVAMIGDEAAGQRDICWRCADGRRTVLLLN